MSLAKKALEDLLAGLRPDLEHADNYCHKLSAWNETAPVGYEAEAAALYLHHLYSAIESMVNRTVRVFDGVEPQGPSSHNQLLDLAFTTVKDVRGPILPPEQQDAIDVLRRFRHRFRKRYDDDVDPAHLQPLVKTTLTAWPAIRRHLNEFVAFVEACASAAQ